MSGFYFCLLGGFNVARQSPNLIAIDGSIQPGPGGVASQDWGASGMTEILCQNSTWGK
jgi:hypothetical protein